jgi:transcriptional regulator with XRE-family HTH domain
MAKSFDALVKKTATPVTRRKAARRTKVLLADLLLSETRKLSGKTQQQLATALGIRQPSLSKLEKQDDMQLSTLRRIIEALGGQLEVLAHFPEVTVRMNQFQSSHRKSRQPKSLRSA